MIAESILQNSTGIKSINVECINDSLDFLKSKLLTKNEVKK